ncbi:anthranilate synthase component II [bacterium]
MENMLIIEPSKLKILIIDNYDSFTYIIADYFLVLNSVVKVIKNDNPNFFSIIKDFNPDALLLSPGPKTPKESGNCFEILKFTLHKIPILGICLGMQIINEFFGGDTVHVLNPIYGMTSQIHHNQIGLFSNIPNPFKAARYHSLRIHNINDNFNQDAYTSDKVVMAISHKKYSIYGLQFHPESFLSEHGYDLLFNFMKIIR